MIFHNSRITTADRNKTSRIIDDRGSTFPWNIGIYILGYTADRVEYISLYSNLRENVRSHFLTLNLSNVENHKIFLQYQFVIYFFMSVNLITKVINTLKPVFYICSRNLVKKGLN